MGWHVKAPPFIGLPGWVFFIEEMYGMEWDGQMLNVEGKGGSVPTEVDMKSSL